MGAFCFIPDLKKSWNLLAQGNCSFLQYYFRTLISGCLVEGACLIARHLMEVQKYIIYQNSGLMDGTDYVTLFTLGQVLRKTVVLLSLTPDVSLKHHDSWENKTTVFI